MNKSYIIAFSIIVFLATLTTLNYWLAWTLQQEQPDLVPVGRALTAAEQAVRSGRIVFPKRRRVLVPDDPAKYGMIEISENQMPREQIEWDALMKKAIIQSGILETPQGRKAVEEMNTSPGDFNETIGRVDESIAAFEQLRTENPDDEHSYRRLQTLYKLKAVGKALSSKVTTLPQPKDLPAPTMVVEELPLPDSGDGPSVPDLLPSPEDSAIPLPE